MESGSPDWIAEYFGLYNRQSVYRHGTAAGLWQRGRRAKVRLQERLLEEAGCVRMSSSAIMAAKSLPRYIDTNAAAEAQALAQASALKTIRLSGTGGRISSRYQNAFWYRAKRSGILYVFEFA